MIKKGYVDTADGQLHYRQLGGGGGAPLVFFHMTASSSRAFEPLMSAMEGRVPMIAFDTVNCGESYRTAKSPDIDYIAAVMLEAMSKLGYEKFHTFGQHTGASIQAAMAVQAPERVASLIVNGPMYATVEEMRPYQDRLAVANPCDTNGTQLMWAWSRIKDNIGLPMVEDMPGAAAIMHRDTVDMLRAGEDWSWGYRAVFNFDLKAAMQQVRCPMLLVCGALDRIYGYHIALSSDFPEAPVHVNDNADCYYIETYPRELAPQIVQFIAGVEPER